MSVTPQQAAIINNCKKSVVWFLSNLVKVKHPTAGVLPFVPFSYQKYALKCFRTNRFNIFKKCRQAGASKISGAFALWYAMFNSYKTVLIVSRTDDTAMEFLADNVKFLFKSLPQWMQDMWLPASDATADNKHMIKFANGSVIKSLTSHPEVLRSNAASLNIIDEAAFIPEMSRLWAAGWSTLQHGGAAIIISTVNGIGNWYHSTWTDAEVSEKMAAEDRLTPFKTVVINWWDMDWAIEYVDPITGVQSRIAPTDGLIKCEGQTIRYGRSDLVLDTIKYGDYWSPWLEEQFRGLQEKGETWKFEQEVLARFMGSGNTVLPKEALETVKRTVVKPNKILTGNQLWVHPVTGQREYLNFSFPDGDGFWVWKPPVRATAGKYIGNKLVEPGNAAHAYVAGVDIASGKAKDYHAIEIFDVDTMEQVAEFMGRCLPRDLQKIIDLVCRWYNCALMVVERNFSDLFITELQEDFMYPRLWRRSRVDDRPKSGGNGSIRLDEYGFTTTSASKPTLNKQLLDFVRADGSGYTIYSERLLTQLGTYVRKRDKAGRDTGKTEAEDGAGNYDDLVMAAGLALIGAPDAIHTDGSLIPTSADLISLNLQPPDVTKQNSLVERGGPSLMMPLTVTGDLSPDESAMMQLQQFAMQLGAMPIISEQAIPSVTQRKHNIDYKR